MYKTISISNDTYQNLHAISTRLNKPKSQVIQDLIKDYSESMKEKEKKELREYNAAVAKLAKRINLPKGTKINTDNMDEDFALLKDTDF